MSNITNLFHIEHVTGKMLQPTFLAGIECEIESIKLVNQDKYPSNLFHSEEDGSLRNNGLEFISKPLNLNELLSGFDNLHNSLSLGQDAFSPRTSTHVHVNCVFMNHEDVRNMMLMYALYEELFFAMVNPVRRDNIHCVPLVETYLPSIYHMSLMNLVTRWHKYTALNLLPLAKQGTMEFRHLQGTDDRELMAAWLCVLDNLQKVSINRPITQAFLNDWTAIRATAHEIFGHVGKLSPLLMMLPNIIGNSLLDVKASFIKE